MIIFLIIAGLMLVVALLFLLPPLLGKRLRFGEISHGQTNISIYRDQLRELEADLVNGTLDSAQYETAKREIERRVLEETDDGELPAEVAGRPQWSLAVAVGVLVPLITISGYLVLGTPSGLDREALVASTQDGGHDMSPQRIAKMVEGLNDRLKRDPDDIEGWVMLAKTTQALGRYQEAVSAYREIVRRVPPDAQLLADFADTLAMANGRTLEGEPQQLIAQALTVDPRNVKALALGGTIAYQQGDYAKAAKLWRSILEIVPPEADFAQRIKESVADAESRAGIKSAPVAQAKPGSSERTGSGAAEKISGSVRLDSAVGKSASPNDTVFIFARAASGPKMPLAIVRLTVKELPTNFELTEAMAMAPGMSISKFPDLVVGARISKTGNAIAQPGDWESELVPAKIGAKGIALVIARPVR